MKVALATVALAAALSNPARAAILTPGHSLQPAQIRVLVLNGTHRIGLAARVSAALERRGFAVQRLKSQVANAPQVSRLTRIYFDPGQPNARVAARQLRELFGPRTAISANTKPIDRLAQHAARPLLVIALGSSFHGLS